MTGQAGTHNNKLAIVQLCTCTCTLHNNKILFNYVHAHCTAATRIGITAVMATGTGYLVCCGVCVLGQVEGGALINK